MIRAAEASGSEKRFNISSSKTLHLRRKSKEIPQKQTKGGVRECNQAGIPIKIEFNFLSIVALQKQDCIGLYP